MALDVGPLPQNLEIERALLGAILLHNDFLYPIDDTGLVAGDFYEPWNGNLFALVKEMVDSQRRVTPTTVLHDLSQDADVGGISAADLLHVIEREGAYVTLELVVDLAVQIRDLAIRRRGIEVCLDSIREFQSAPATMRAGELAAKLDGNIASLFGGLGDLGIRHLGDVAAEVVDIIGTPSRMPIGLPLGMKHAHDLIGPLLPGKLVILAGSPGSGKSALAQQWFEWITRPRPDAPQEQRRGLMFQIEMDAEETSSRSLTAATAINAHEILRGDGAAAFGSDNYNRLFDAARELKRGGFYLDCSASPSAATIRSKAVRKKRMGGLDVIGIDHLQYIERPDRKMSEVEAIGPNLRFLKRMAKDLRLPVLCLAQLKAAYSEGPVRRPRISDLWNSSAVEQNADIILFVHRPEYMILRNEPEKGTTEYAKWELEKERWSGKAELILGKRRDGQGYGTKTIRFDSKTVRFADNPSGLHSEMVDPTAPPRLELA